MTVKTSEDKVKKHISKELIRRIIKFEYENLLLLKSPQKLWYIVTSNIVMIKQSKTSQTYPISQEHFEIVIDFTDEPVVQCNVKVVKTLH